MVVEILDFRFQRETLSIARLLLKSPFTPSYSIASWHTVFLFQTVEMVDFHEKG